MSSAAPRIAQQEETTQIKEHAATTQLQQAKRTYEKPTEAKESKFHTVMTAVAKSTKRDSKYHRMALNTTEEKKWFKNLMYLLWDRQITRNEFIARGVAKCPDHKYEFTYIANAFQNY